MLRLKGSLNMVDIEIQSWPSLSSSRICPTRSFFVHREDARDQPQRLVDQGLEARTFRF